MRFTLKELREDVYPVFPHQASAVIEHATSPFSIATNPSRRLLEIDVANLFKTDGSSRFRPVEPTALPEITLEIRELAYQEVPGQSQTKAVTLSSYQVDTLYAVLYMPRNASFLFDVVTTDSKIEFAYEIVVLRKGLPIANRLVRDGIEDHASQCANPRIVNVFGGISGASGWPSRVTQEYCSAPSQSSGMKGLKESVLERVASESAALLNDNIP